MKIDHVNIVVTDLDKSIEFYKAIGFDLAHSDVLEGDWVSKVVGIPNVKAKYAKLSLDGRETFLELIQYYSPAGGTDPKLSQPNQIGFRHMAIKVYDIEKIVTTLKDNNVEFFSDVQLYEPANKKLIYFYGPDREILEFAQYGEAK